MSVVYWLHYCHGVCVGCTDLHIGVCLLYRAAHRCASAVNTSTLVCDCSTVLHMGVYCRTDRHIGVSHLYRPAHQYVPSVQTCTSAWTVRSIGSATDLLRSLNLRQVKLALCRPWRCMTGVGVQLHWSSDVYSSTTAVVGRLSLSNYFKGASLNVRFVDHEMRVSVFLSLIRIHSPSPNRHSTIAS